MEIQSSRREAGAGLCVLSVALAGVLIIALLALAPAAQAATFQLQVSVTGQGRVTSDSGKIDCGGPVAQCSGSYAEDCEFDPETNRTICFPADETLTAAGSNGFSFAGWSGCPGAVGPSCSLSISRATAVTATFTDQQPPSVALTSPSLSNVIGASLGVAATAGDNAGVARVDFSVRGVVVASDTSAPYSALINTSALADGQATVAAIAYDQSGNTSSPSATTITLDNTDPGITFVDGPAEGGTVAAGQPVTLGFSATDANPIAARSCVVVVAGASPVYGDCGSGTLETGVLTSGSYEFWVKVTDQAGNVSVAVRSFSAVEAPSGPEARALTLRFKARSSAFAGRITAATAACLANQKVTVRRLSHGQAKKIGTAKTDGAGRFRIGVSRAAGKFFASIPASSPAAVAGGCAAARSKTLRVG